jgi:hypothetical protein
MKEYNFSGKLCDFFFGWQRRECRKWTGKKKKVSQIDWQRRGKLWFCDANGQ